MNKYQEGIIEEVKQYIQDRIYPYAMMIDGTWGIGKTYFIGHDLIPELEKDIDKLLIKKIKYISLHA